LARIKIAFSCLIDDVFSPENCKTTLKYVIFEVSAVRDTPLIWAPLAKKFFVEDVFVDVSKGG
jgi:hypothetical protein